jgi:XTP/dITP diphosphohydrolase
MVTLLIATRNTHKVGEIRAILGEGFRYLTLNDFPNAPEVVEDAGTFTGNATKKAVALAKWFAQPGTRKPNASFNRSGEAAERILVLSDDSGLEVDALNGAPGVHSARFATLDTGRAGNSGSAENNAKLLRLLGDLPLERRTARFRCVLAAAPVPCGEPKGASPVCYAEEAELQTELFEGTCEGLIGFAPCGQRGFGYDPLFIPSGYEQTFGELSEASKNRLSHRAMALTKLKRWLQAAQEHGLRT